MKRPSYPFLITVIICFTFIAVAFILAISFSENSTDPVVEPGDYWDPAAADVFVSQNDYVYRKMGEYIYRGEALPGDVNAWTWEAIAPAYRTFIDTVANDTIRYAITHLTVTDTLRLEGVQ